MIYLSTGGFSGKTFVESAGLLAGCGITALELSAGRPVGDVESALRELAARCNLVLHNYFPPPPEPFVLNLASLNDGVSRTSMAHVRRAIDLSVVAGSRWFSFHAGFLMDPQVDELGKKIAMRQLNNRSEATEVFIARVLELAHYAGERNIRLLIENNVLSANNFRQFGCNPLLMVDPVETAAIMERLQGRVGLLVDVAHLKVSARSLGFDPAAFLQQFAGITEAYHLSDNDGLSDSNGPIAPDAWFWPWIRRDLHYYTIEVYDPSPEKLRQQYEIVQEGLGVYGK